LRGGAIQIGRAARETMKRDAALKAASFLCSGLGAV